MSRSCARTVIVLSGLAPIFWDSSRIRCSKILGAYPERTITVRAHERKKKKKGKTMKQIIRKQTDISSFKEILNIQKQDMARSHNIGVLWNHLVQYFYTPR